MAKITRQKCRKEVKCSKCGKAIEKGQEYLKAVPFRARPIIRCLGCGLKYYETSHSEYVQEVGRVVEEWTEDYEINNNTADNIAERLQEILDDCQDSLDNMPEQLQETSIIQERIDMLQDVINDLESLNSLDDYITDNEDEEFGKDEYMDAINDCLMSLEY